MTRLALALLVALAWVLGAAAPASAVDGEPRVVVLGAPGLTLADLSPEVTPTLWEMAKGGATGNLVVRGAYLQTCGGDGWLSLGAGDRVAVPRPGSPDLDDPGAAPECPEPQSDEIGAVAGWSEIAELARERKADATLGVLADSLVAAGTCVEPAGGPAARLGAADANGEVGDGSIGCAVRLVDVGAVQDEGGEAGRAGQVRAVDTAVGEATADLAPGTLVVVAGLGDDGAGPALRAVIYSGGTDAGPAAEPGALHSVTTRRTGVVQLPDLTADILERVGAEPAAPVAGRPLTLVRDGGQGEADERITDQSDVAGQLAVANRSIPPFFYGFAAVVVLSTVLGTAAWVGVRRKDSRTRQTTSLGLRGLALTLASVPAATFGATLTRWWAADRPTLALAGAVAGLALLLGLGALAVTRGAGRRTLTAVGVVGGVTALILTADLLLRDGEAIFLGVLGLHPWDGGRFYGFGNVPFALFATGGLLATTALLDPFVRRGRRREATLVAALCAVVILLVDAAPFAGADGGGMLALIPALGFLVLAVSGARITLPRLLLIGVATVVGFLTIAGLDHLRPEESRSHLGRFFGRILSGDAWAIIERKLLTNVEMLLGPQRAALLVPVGLVLAIWALARPGSTLARPLAGPLEDYPALRPGLIALVVALTAGFLLNDSGTAIPGVAAIILAPALAALAVGSHRSAAATPTARRSPAAPPPSATPGSPSPSSRG